MNTPTHLMAGALTAQVAIFVTGEHARRDVRIAGGVCCFILAVGSHLGLDLVPHYNWIIYLNWFEKLPFHWLLREAVFSWPVVAFAVYCGHDHSVLTAVGLFGGIYPDFEKVAYLDFNLPARYVVFPWHSLRTTPFWKYQQSRLIALEVAIFVLMALVTFGLAVWRKRRNAPVSRVCETPPAGGNSAATAPLGAAPTLCD